MAKVDKFVSKTLLANGFSQAELETMSAEEIMKVYQNGVQRLVNAFNTHPKEEHNHQIKNPFLDLKAPDEIYDISVDFFSYMKIEDVVIMMHRHFRIIPIDKIQKIVRLLMYIFQEKILGEIESKIANLPVDEREAIMEIYERQKDDIHHLLQINERLEKEECRKQFERILSIKNSIDHFRKIQTFED